MAGTVNPQEDSCCPNCGVEGCDVSSWKEGDDYVLIDCDNQNCSVGRYWGLDPSLQGDKGDL